MSRVRRIAAKAAPTELPSVRSVGAVLAAIVLLTACTDRTPPEPEDQSIRPARIFVVSSSDAIQRRQFVGRVEAAQAVDVTFEVSGPLVELPVLEGQTIARGDLVAALDPTDFELAVREAEVQLQLARQDLERKRQVLAQRGIARSVVDDAQSMYQLQQVRLDKAKQSLADSRLMAPFDAYVSRRYVDNFVTVSVGQKIVRLNDLHTLLIVANIPEELYATGSQDQVVDNYVEFDFLPGERFPVSVQETSGDADTVAQTYEVSLVMERPSQWNILPGMTATVTVEFRDPETAGGSLLIPASALVGDAEGGFIVWVYDSQTGYVDRRSVLLGTPTGAGVNIASGLNDGEMIVATGASQLQVGMRVAVLGEPTSQI